jgi:hypothetical protein
MQEWRILVGDVREKLRELPAGSVQTCVTSPPYWGLRDYGTAQWSGGDPACSHFKLAGGVSAQGLGKSVEAMTANVERSSVPYRDICGKCGARRVDNQIGLEPSPDAYVQALVEVFRDVQRVLRDDGVIWGIIYMTPVLNWNAPDLADLHHFTSVRPRVSFRESSAVSSAARLVYSVLSACKPAPCQRRRPVLLEGNYILDSLDH